MEKFKKSFLGIGAVLLVFAVALPGCTGETSDQPADTEEVEAPVDVDSSLIDEIESQAEGVELTGEMIENADLGIKVACPGTEEWSCNTSSYAISAHKTVDGYAVGGVVMGVMTISPTLEDANDFYTGIYKADTLLSKKTTDDYIATYIVLDTFGSLTRKLIYIRELADGKYLQCDADSYLSEENFEYIAAETAKLCLSVENL